MVRRVVGRGSIQRGDGAVDEVRSVQRSSTSENPQVSLTRWSVPSEYWVQPPKRRNSSWSGL